MGQQPARWIRPDGTTIFPTTQDLQVGATEAGIATPSRIVWSGCGDNFGQPFNGYSCHDWTVTTLGGGMDIGNYGASDRTDTTWSFAYRQGCEILAPLYCFESDVP